MVHKVYCSLFGALTNKIHSQSQYSLLKGPIITTSNVIRKKTGSIKNNKIMNKDKTEKPVCKMQTQVVLVHFINARWRASKAVRSSGTKTHNMLY